MSPLFAPGTVVDRYQIDGVLGQGGMGLVLSARHVHLGTRHALKVLVFQSPALAQRLLREGRVQAGLRHPNIVPVTDVAEVPGGLALVLELIDGPGLMDWADAFKRSGPQIDALAEGMFAGLEAAHDAGVVHRDLKPANVLLSVEPERLVCRITDFGLARLVDQQMERMTRTGQTMGTPAYMPPEQHRNAKDIDHRADLFSLGAVLYELVCGNRAFTAEDVPTIYNQMTSRSYLPLADAAPGAPARFVRAIEAALDPDPAGRPASVAAMRALWRAGTVPPVDPWSASEIASVRAWWLTRGAAPAHAPTVSAAQGTAAPRVSTVSGVPPLGGAGASTAGADRRSTGGATLLPGVGGAALVAVVALVGMVAAGGAVWWSLRPPGEDAVGTGVPAEGGDPLVGMRAAPGAAGGGEAPGAADAGVATPSAAPAVPGVSSAPPPAAESRTDRLTQRSEVEDTRPRSKAPGEASTAVVPAAGPAERASVNLVGVGRGELVGGDGRAWSAASPVPPGEYELRVWFEPDVATSVLTVSLAPGAATTIQCSSGVRRCR